MSKVTGVGEQWLFLLNLHELGLLLLPALLCSLTTAAGAGWVGRKQDLRWEKRPTKLSFL